MVVDELGGRRPRAGYPTASVDALDKDEFLARLEAGRPRPSALRGGRAPRGLHRHGGATRTTLFRNNVEYSARLLAWTLGPRHSVALRVVGRRLRSWSEVRRDARVRGAPRRLRSLEVALRPAGARGPRLRVQPGCRPALLQRLRSRGGPQGRDGEHDHSVSTPRAAAGARSDCSGASHGWAAGEQRRDFIHVEDAVAVTRWFLEHPDRSGIFNVGTGTSTSFNELARLVLSPLRRGRHRVRPDAGGGARPVPERHMRRPVRPQARWIRVDLPAARP